MDQFGTTSRAFRNDLEYINPPTLFPLPTCLVTSWDETSLSNNNFVSYSTPSQTSTSTITTAKSIPSKANTNHRELNGYHNNDGKTLITPLETYLSSVPDIPNALQPSKRFCSCGVSTYRANCGTICRALLQYVPVSRYCVKPRTVKPTELIWWMSTVSDSDVSVTSSTRMNTTGINHSNNDNPSTVPTPSITKSSSSTIPMSPVDFMKSLRSTSVIPSSDTSRETSLVNASNLLILPGPSLSSSSSSSSSSLLFSSLSSSTNDDKKTTNSSPANFLKSTSPVFNSGATMGQMNDNLSSRYLVSSLPHLGSSTTTNNSTHENIIPANTVRLYLCSTHIATQITSPPHITMDIPLKAITTIDIQIDHDVQKKLAPSLTSAQFIYNLQQPDPNESTTFLSPLKVASEGSSSAVTDNAATGVPVLSKGIFARIRIEFTTQQAKLVRHQDTIQNLTEYLNILADTDIDKNIDNLDQIEKDYQQYLLDDQEYLQRLRLPPDNLAVITIIASLADLSQSNLLYFLESRVRNQSITYGLPFWTTNGLNGSLLYWILLRPCWYTWLRGGTPSMKLLERFGTGLTSSESNRCRCCIRSCSLPFWRTKGPKLVEIIGTFITMLTLLATLRSTYNQLPEYQEQINSILDSIVNVLGPRVYSVIETLSEWNALIFFGFGPLFTNLFNILYKFGSPFVSFISTLFLTQSPLFRLLTRVVSPLYIFFNFCYRIVSVMSTGISQILCSTTLRNLAKSILAIINMVITFFMQIKNLAKRIPDPTVLPPIGDHEPGAFVHIASPSKYRKQQEKPSPREENTDTPTASSSSLAISSNINLHPSSYNQLRHRLHHNGLPPPNRTSPKGTSPKSKSDESIKTPVRSKASKLGTIQEDHQQDPVNILSPTMLLAKFRPTKSKTPNTTTTVTDDRPKPPILSTKSE